MNQSAGEWLRDKRIDAMLGLRQFARLIEDSPSNVCNIENGKRRPWQNSEKLTKVAEVLGIPKNSADWDTLFRIVTRPQDPPKECMKRLKASHAKLSEQVREARKVIFLYRRWEHAEEADNAAEVPSDEMSDLDTMLTEASFAAAEFVEKWEGKIKPLSP